MLRVLLLALVVGLLLWWWLRRPSARRAAPEAAPPPKAQGPEAMVRCAECGVHVPAGQALPGRGGHFCGAPHRQLFEQRHPE